MASIIFPRDCPPLEPGQRGSRTMKPKRASASASSVLAIAKSSPFPTSRKIVDARLPIPRTHSPRALANPLSDGSQCPQVHWHLTMAAALEWNLNRGQRNVCVSSRSAATIACAARIRRDTDPHAREPASPRKRFVRFAARLFFADLKGDVDALGTLANSFTWNEAAPPGLHPAVAVYRPQQRILR